jgi:hypothetical protein
MNKLLYFLLLSIFFSSCRKEATVWYSGWVVPLMHDTLNLSKLTNDSTLTIENGFYALNLSRKIASIKPSDYVKIPDTSIVQKFAIVFPTLLVQPGSSFVTDNKDHIFDLDEIQLKKARIKKGKIILEVFSPIQTPTFFEIELPSVTQDDLAIKKTLQVPAGSPSNQASNKIELDLSGHFIEMIGSDGISFNALPSRLKIFTDPNGSQVNLTSSDSTTFELSMEGIELDYARGYFGNYKFTDSYTFVSEFLKNKVMGTIDLPNMELKLEFSNGIKTSAKADLKKLNNINSSNSSSVLLSHPIIGNPFTIQSATGNWSNFIPSKKEIIFDASNSNLTNFIENLGETTEIEYELELNPWGNISGGWDEFFPSSSLDVNLDLKMPLQIGLDNLILRDTFDVSFNQDYEKTHVESGILHLKVENAFPLEGQISLFFLDEFNQIIAEIDDLEKVKSSVFGSMTSFGILSNKSEINVNLDESILLKLNEIKYIFASVKLNSPNAISLMNEQIEIPEKAFFKLKAQASFNLENRIK